MLPNFDEHDPTPKPPQSQFFAILLWAVTAFFAVLLAMALWRDR